jgi:thiol-disulfide isomerase/thioredoxin
MSNRRARALTLVGIAALAGLAGCRRAPDAPPAGETVVLQFFKDPAPVADFSAETLDGATISAASLRGKVTLVNFWATWCPPCRAEIPDLIALQQKYGDHLQIIGISEDAGATDVVQRFVAEHGINYPIVMATPELERTFSGVNALPTSFILDREARIVQRHVGLTSVTRLDHETRALAGLPIDASIEFVERPRHAGLENAAQAKEIPGVDLTGLSAEKRVATLLRLNEEPCTCGCELTVARCRIEDPACGVSLPLARRLVSEIAGKAGS